MEPDQNIQNQGIQSESPFVQNQPTVSFPAVGQPRKSGGPKMFLIIGILILVGILGFVIYKSASKGNDVISDESAFLDNSTTSDSSVDTQPTQAATSTPTPLASSKPADKSAVSVEVQNGTGITGEAAYLQTQLKDLGYTNIKVGNASSTNATATTVTFGKDVASAIVTEITKKLESIYTTVTAKTATSGSDIVIVTGLRKGATTKPSSTPTATPKASATSSATPTATPTN